MGFVFSGWSFGVHLSCSVFFSWLLENHQVNITEACKSCQASILYFSIFRLPRLSWFPCNTNNFPSLFYSSKSNVPYPRPEGFRSTFEAYFNTGFYVYCHWCHLFILQFVCYFINQLTQKYLLNIMSKPKITGEKKGEKTLCLLSKSLQNGGERGWQTSTTKCGEVRPPRRLYKVQRKQAGRSSEVSEAGVRESSLESSQVGEELGGWKWETQSEWIHVPRSGGGQRERGLLRKSKCGKSEGQWSMEVWAGRQGPGHKGSVFQGIMGSHPRILGRWNALDLHVGKTVSTEAWMIGGNGERFGWGRKLEAKPRERSG